jgi:hypothetical protein
MCEQATILRTQVNVNVLNFDNLLREVLNGSSNMSLPATFKKIVKANPADNPKQASSRVKGEGNGRDKKKRESKNRNGILAKNMSQDNNFKVATGKMWKNTFSKKLPQIAQSGRIYSKCAQDSTSTATAMTTAHV